MNRLGPRYLQSWIRTSEYTCTGEFTSPPIVSQAIEAGVGWSMPIAYIVVVIVALMANTPPSFGETVSPNAKLKIILESNQRETMILEASKFAVEKGFSFEDIGAQLPPLKDRRVVHLRLKRQNRMEIHISNDLADDTFFLGIYERKPAQQWQSLLFLHQAWPVY